MIDSFKTFSKSDVTTFMQPRTLVYRIFNFEM